MEADINLKNISFHNNSP